MRFKSAIQFLAAALLVSVAAHAQADENLDSSKFTPSQKASLQWLGIATQNLRMNWVKGPINRFASAQGESSGRVFMREVRAGKSSFSVGTVSYFSLPVALQTPESTYRDILNTLKVGMGIPNWNQRTVGDVQVFEGDWEKGRRLMRVFVRADRGRLEMSVASVRKTYAVPVSLEMELLQRHLFGVLMGSQPGKNYPALGWMDELIASAAPLIDSVFTPAYAQSGIGGLPIQLPVGGGGLGGGIFGGGGIPPLPIGGGGGNPLDGLTGILNELGGLQSQLGTLGNQLTGSINGATGTVSGISNTWTNNLHTTMGQLTGLSNQWQGTANQMVSLGNTFNTNMANTNKILTQMIDPSHDFMMAGALAAGAATGALAVHVGVMALSKVGDMILDKMGWKGTKKAEDRLAAFAQAREVYEKSDDMVESMEKSIDALLNVYSFAQTKFVDKNGNVINGITNEILVREFNAAALRAETEEKILQKRLTSAMEREDGTCAAQISEQMAEIQKPQDDFRKIASILDNPHFNICNALGSDFRTIREAEGKIQRAREAMLAKENQVLADTYKVDAQEHKDNKVAASDGESRKREEIVKDKSRVDADHSMKEIDKQRKNLKKDCENIFKSIKDELKKDKVKMKVAFDYDAGETCKQAVFDLRTDVSSSDPANTAVHLDHLEALLNGFDPQYRAQATEAFGNLSAQI